MSNRNHSSRSGDGKPARLRPRAGPRLAELDRLEVVVEKLVAGGDGLARFEGIPIFVARSAPGDRLRVRLVERRPDYGRAEIVEILQPGPGRRSAPCPHFARCGGCDLQHLEDDLQIELKVAAFRETLVRLGGLSPSLEVEVLAGEPWGYRLRTQVHTAGEGEELRVGYRARRSDAVVAVKACPVLVPQLDGRLPDLAQLLPQRPPRRLDLVAGDGGALSTAPVTPHLPHGALSMTVGEFTYELDARCFFQAHRQLLPRLVERVVGEWKGDSACDLFAGIGLFSLPLARRYTHVVAVEVDRVASRYARRNAQRYRLGRLRTVNSAVESWIAELPPNVDRLIVDPPRLGLSKRLRHQIRHLRPRRLTYASCHPAALARDLKDLVGLYSIERLTLMDMFPQTGHMEAVVQLTSSTS